MKSPFPLQVTEVQPLTNEVFWKVITSDMFMTEEDREGIRRRIVEARNRWPAHCQ